MLSPTRIELAHGEDAKVLEVARDKIRRRAVAGNGFPAVGGAAQMEAAVGALGVSGGGNEANVEEVVSHQGLHGDDYVAQYRILDYD